MAKDCGGCGTGKNRYPPSYRRCPKCSWPSRTVKSYSTKTKEYIVSQACKNRECRYVFV